MAAPAATPRGTPTGIKLKDGYSTKVTLSLNTTIELWEKTVKPPGIDGGDAIQQTTMHNTTWRTFASRGLLTLTEHTFKAAYDPSIYTSILSMINVQKVGTSAQVITVTFPDGSTLAFYGYVKMFEPDEHQEGTQPEATVTITPTNYDPVNNVEAAPVLTSVAGT